MIEDINKSVQAGFKITMPKTKATLGSPVKEQVHGWQLDPGNRTRV